MFLIGVHQKGMHTHILYHLFVKMSIPASECRENDKKRLRGLAAGALNVVFRLEKDYSATIISSASTSAASIAVVSSG